MEEKLMKKLKERFAMMLAAMAILLCIALFMLIGSLLTVLGVTKMIEMGDETELLASAVFFLGAIVAAVVTLRPFLRDYRSIRKHEYRVLEAVFVRYDFQKTGDENSRLRRIPLFCDTVTREMLTFDLDEELIQDECYRIAYLPKSRTAVIEKVKNEIENISDLP